MKFRKPALSIPDLVQRLKDRGLGVPDPSEAEHYLSFNGYYRLSAYALPLQDKGAPSSGPVDKPFKPGTSFTVIMAKQLRRLNRTPLKGNETTDELCTQRYSAKWLVI